MANHSDVAAAWADGRSRIAGNLKSDGRSLFSYHWYEIARHVAPSIIYVRHQDEHYSQSTTQHMGHIWGAIHGARRWQDGGPFVFYPRHKSGGTHRAAMGEPDWELASWVQWFKEEYPKGMGVKIRQVSCRGSALRVALRDAGSCFLLKGFAAQDAGVGYCEISRGKVQQVFTLSGGARFARSPQRDYGFFAEMFPLDHLDPWPEAAVTDQLTAELRKGSAWKHRLFPRVVPVDIRQKLNFEPPVDDDNG